MNTRRVTTLVAVGCLASGAVPQAAQAQDTARRASSFEILVPTGMLVPTGAQRSAIRRGNLSAVQVAWAASPAFAITTTLGWARTRDAAVVGDTKVDVFTYDVGAELRARPGAGHSAGQLMTFAGAGVGGRSYRHRQDGADARHNLAAYASVGGEVGLRRIRLRLDVRDYVTGYTALDGGASGTRVRNDVVVMAGLRLVRR